MLILILIRLLGFRLIFYYCKEIIIQTLDYSFSDTDYAFFEAVLHVLIGLFIGCLSGYFFKSAMYHFFPNSILAELLKALPLFSPPEFPQDTTVNELLKRLLEHSTDSDYLEDTQSPHDFMKDLPVNEVTQRAFEHLEYSNDLEVIENTPQPNKSNGKISIRKCILAVAIIIFIYSF